MAIESLKELSESTQLPSPEQAKTNPAEWARAMISRVTEDYARIVRTLKELAAASGGGGGAHAASHQNNGSDEITVQGLSGLLADAQTPLTHSIIGAAHDGFPGGTSTFLRADKTFAALPSGIAVLDFGTTPADEASVVVTGQAGIVSGSQVRAFFMQEATADNGVNEHAEAAALCALVCGAIVVGTGFTIFAHPIAAKGSKTFNVRWAWA